METAEDYRDTLRQLFDILRHEPGMTISQIAKQSEMSEQILAGVLRKERNLSAQSLTRLLSRLGYTMHFEKIISPASSPSVPNKS
jgi:transcriptional regulator with XRE-family HTH domain